MATGMQINNTAIPDPMDARGAYAFSQPAIGRNGRGAAVVAPYSVLTWTFDYLTPAEYAWWATTLLGGAASAEYTQAKLFNALGALTTYTHCVVMRPSYARYQDGLMHEVTVTIDWIY